MALVNGEDFELATFDTTQVRLDGDYVKDLLEELLLAGKITPAQKLACFKEISFVTMKANRKDKTKKPKYEPPAMTQMTPEGVADLLGDVREKIKNLKADETTYKDWLDRHFKLTDQGPDDKAPESMRQDLEDDKPDWA